MIKKYFPHLFFLTLLLWSAIFCIAPIFSAMWHAPGTCFSLLLGICIIIYTVYSYFNFLYTQKLLHSLPSNSSTEYVYYEYNIQCSHDAQYSHSIHCLDNKLPVIQSYLQNYFTVQFSLILLTTALGLLIALGFYIESPINGFSIFLWMNFILLIFGYFLTFLNFRSYKYNLELSHQTIITSQFTYFLGYFYFNKDALKTINVKNSPFPTLEFTYHPYTIGFMPEFNLIIPIPSDSLEIIQKIFAL